MFAQLHLVPTPDLSVEMLSTLSAVMLAQGQESIWNKTEQGDVKPYDHPFHSTCTPARAFQL